MHLLLPPAGDPFSTDWLIQRMTSSGDFLGQLIATFLTEGMVTLLNATYFHWIYLNHQTSRLRFFVQRIKSSHGTGMTPGDETTGVPQWEVGFKGRHWIEHAKHEKIDRGLPCPSSPSGLTHITPHWIPKACTMGV